MRDRLIELLDNLLELGYSSPYVADYLLENGVIVPPVSVGQTVYKVNGIKAREYKVDYFDIFNNIVNFTFKIHLIADDWSDFVFADDFGKTVFLTKEEAENALKERERG